MIRFLWMALSALLVLGSCSWDRQSCEPQVDFSAPLLPVLKFIPSEEQQKENAQTMAWLFMITNGRSTGIPIHLNFYKRADTFCFSPLFPLGNNLEFEWQIINGKDTIKKRFRTEDMKVSDVIPEIVSIYPLTDTVPSNILLFHIRFNTPMNEDLWAYRHVHIINEKGDTIPFAWRQKSSWTDSGRHLVMMVHPGRIKTGINYAKETGPLFETGKRYTLLVSPQLISRGNRALQNTFSKSLFVTTPDLKLPKAIKTTQAFPKAGTLQTVYIAFNEAIDYGSAQIGLQITNSAEQLVKGRFQPISDSKWMFTPSQIWQADTYSIIYIDEVCDLASNRFSRPFEVNDIEEMKRENGVIETFTTASK